MPKLSDLMFDIETFGIGSDAAVVSIGACMFNPFTGDISAKEDDFYIVLDINDPLIGDITPSTVQWWLRQSDAARAAIADPAVERVGVVKACRAFAEWTKKQGNVRAIWSNGPTFDETITRSLCARAGVKFPVHFRESACCRTRARFARSLGYAARDENPNRGVAHNALDDARSQVVWVSAATRYIMQYQPRTDG